MWRTILALMLMAVPHLASGTETRVSNGTQLQAAINAAQGGDTIVLTPGVVYSGSFTLPVHPGTTYVTIRTAADNSVMPGSTGRITPAYAPYLAKLRGSGPSPIIRTAPGAAYWRLLFVEIGPTVTPSGDLVALGDGSSAQFTLDLVPDHLILDRVYLHGDPLAGQKRGVALNSAETTIINCYFADLKTVGTDSQAIAGWNGPGPYRIENNYLESAGTSVLFGGDDPKISGLVPTDITFRGNTVSRPVRWRDAILSAPTNVQAIGFTPEPEPEPAPEPTPGDSGGAPGTGSDPGSGSTPPVETPPVGTVSALDAGTGGALPAGTYGYRVVARRTIGTTLIRSAASAQVTATVGNLGSVTIQWAAVEGAVEYLVYGRTPGGVNRYWRVTSTAFTDDGTTTGTSGTPAATTVWQVKNLFELKNARQVQADFNVFENNWAQAQAGTAILFTPRNQYGRCTWCTVEDVTFEYNIVRSIAGGIQVLGSDNLNPSQQANAIRIRNNLVYDLTKSWGSNAYFLYVTRGPATVTVDHNTIIAANGSGVVMADGGQATDFVFTNNLARHNSYGIFGTGSSAGTSTLNTYFPGATIARNVLAGGKASIYPAGNEFPSTANFEAHFRNYSGNDFALVPDTNWQGTGTDGLDLGADIAAIFGERKPPKIDPPDVTTTSLVDATRTVPYEAPLAAAGGVAPYRWAIVDGGLPDGLALTGAGVIGGTPAVRGDFAFRVQVTDSAGATATQALLLHVAKPPNIMPGVAMTGPLDQTTARLGTTLTIAAAATDIDGSIARIDLYQGDTLIGSAASDSIAVPWQVRASGAYHFTAVATDDEGGTATSTAVAVSTRAEVVLYAADVMTLVGNYQLTADATAAGGTALWNPDKAAAKVTTAVAAPGSYAEFTFYAEAGRPYHLWIRGKGQKNYWANDSAFIQFSGVGEARIGTTASLTYSLEVASNAGIAGWGWEDNGWGGVNVLGAHVTFDTTGVQTLRIQPREDGLSIDQIVLSPEQYLTTPPGVLKNDATILPR